jgi:hypothetical protein
VVKVVAAVITTGLLPLEKAFSLVLNGNALFKLRVVISTAVTSIHWYEKCVEFILGVVTRLVSVGGDTSIVVKERHLSYKLQ